MWGGGSGISKMIKNCTNHTCVAGSNDEARAAAPVTKDGRRVRSPPTENLNLIICTFRHEAPNPQQYEWPI